ncbi:hypothetical protein A3K42_01710, partial [candidate division WWE3 bacterium RBG_13_37_7]
YHIARLKFTKEQKPVMAQIWGNKPETFYEAAKIVESLRFDGIDINMGCPQRNITKLGAGAALIENKSLAKEIIQAVKEGVKNIPVSVKTRIGFKKIETKEWISFLLEQNLDALTVHGRTAKELSKVPCHWDEIGKAVNLRDQINKETILIGNGDIKNYAEAVSVYKKFKVDGVMIGRGIFNDLTAFNKGEVIYELGPSEKLDLLLKHTKLYNDTWKGKKDFNVMKKFFKIYTNGFNGAKELRIQLMKTKNYEEVVNLLTMM